MPTLEQRVGAGSPARPITLRARTGSPACIAAKVTSAAGLSGMTWLSDCSVAMAWPSFAIATGYG
ncbi:Uncharacterised protein [Mycobacterium tuberculosis]|nr:Uncharacterised protein [Mycobacterium tuberculosis]